MAMRNGIMQAWVGGGDAARSDRRVFPRLSALSHAGTKASAGMKASATRTTEFLPSPGAHKMAHMDDLEADTLQLDPFQKLLDKLAQEHGRVRREARAQVGKLREENTELRKRLNTVLSTTWSFSEDAWHGAPGEPEAGELQLVCSPHATATSNMVWKVTEQDQAMQQVARPVNFKPRSYWQTIKEVAQNPGKSEVTRERTTATVVKDDRGEIVDRTEGCMRHFVIAPTSTLRLSWDILAMFLLLYDMIVIPLGAFDLAETTFTVTMDFSILGFWTIDMVLSFFTGFLERGRTIMRPKRIARNYLTSWFLLDVLVVVPDWVFTILKMATDSGNGAGNITGLLRAFRIVRLFRLLRIAKLRKFVTILKDRIESETTFIVIAIFEFIGVLVLLNHLLGSLWYLIGNHGKENGSKNWIEEHTMDGESLGYRYFTSYHWALANFAPGWMSMQPHNVEERLFAIFVLLLGMILFSAFVSSITSMMAKMQNMQSEASKQIWLLRRYLRQNKVPKSLSVRVISYLEYACSNQTHVIAESRLSILTFLSDQLRRELKYSVSYGSLLSHPLFKTAEETSQVVMHTLADTALSSKPLVSQDVLFQYGTLSTHMYMVVSGQVLYMKENSPDVMLSENDWLCEPALWVMWACRGDAMAVADTQVVSIDVQAFGEVVRKDQSLNVLMSSYAEVFVESLNTTSFDDLTDACRNPADISDVEYFLQDSRKRVEELSEPRRGGSK